MIEYRFRVPSAAVFTLYSYSKALEYRFRVPTTGSLTTVTVIDTSFDLFLVILFLLGRTLKFALLIYFRCLIFFIVVPKIGNFVIIRLYIEKL
jgi:hypothetical protein